ncbi:MAG: hypothetical protein U0269_19475 [Polyangiales bacterium]
MPAFRVRVAVSINGRSAREIAGRHRGIIDFESLDRRTHAEFDMGFVGPGEFDIDLPAGTYRVAYRASNGDSQDSPVPRSVVVESLDVQSDRSLDLAINTRLTSIALTLDGAAITAAQRLRLISADGAETELDQPAGSARVVVEHVAGARFEALRPAQPSCVSGSIHCACAYLGAIDTSASSSFAFALQSIELTAEFSRNGQRVAVADRADIELRALGGERSSSCAIRLDANQARRRMFAGSYRVSVVRAGGLVTSNADTRDVELDGGAPLAMDLRTVRVPTAITLDGAPIEAADPGSSVFLLFRGRDGAVLASAGRSSLPTLELVPMEASVEAWVLNGECSERRPCGRAEVRAFGAIDADTRIQADLRSIAVSTDVRVDQRAATEAESARVALALRYGASSWQFEPFAAGRPAGAVHLLPGRFQPVVVSRACSIADPVLCAQGAPLGPELDFAQSAQQRVSIEHVTVRDRLRVVRASNGDELDSTQFAVRFTDERGYSWSGPIDPRTRQMNLVLPAQRFTAQSEASPCSFAAPARTACFSTMVFGCP